MATPPKEVVAGQCENCGETSATFSDTDAKHFRTNKVKRAQGGLKVCLRCLSCFTTRCQATTKILNSGAAKKVIVAGPGTGKSFTFTNLLSQLPDGKPSLVFTLINNLVDELERDLGQLGNEHIKVNTLHGFCKEILHKKQPFDDLTASFEYFPALPIIVEADADFLQFKITQNAIHHAFATLDEEAEALKVFLRLSAYYNAVSHNDSVYRVFTYYREHPDQVPAFEVVIVDEYQDFNRLEASFIQSLAGQNKVVIAGDDDQALYRFRHASNQFLRDLWKRHDFERFSLPYCSRCTPVLVEATNGFITNVRSRGLLQGRIDRIFECYWPDKHAEHNTYPRILVANCSKLKTTCLFVAQRILEIVEKEGLKGDEKEIQFMIVGPESAYHLKQVQETLAVKLDSKLFELQFTEKKDPLVIEQAYSMLTHERNLNLAWRIILYCDPIPETAQIITTAFEKGMALVDLLPDAYRDKHTQQANTRVESPDDALEEEPSKRIRVKLTNFYGSKGLSALHAIVIGLNDGVFPKNPNKLEDDEVCKFIVALTRAKRSCCLVHNGEFDKELGYAVNKPSTYIQLLPSTALEHKKFKINRSRLVEC